MNEQQDVFWQTLLGRRSIRRYRPDPVPPEILEKVLTAASWAPSAHNRQPWRLAVITTPASKLALVEAMGSRWRQDLLRAGKGEDEIEARLQHSRHRLMAPPALVVGCLTMIDMDDYADERLQQAERTMAIQSVALALGNLMLAAHHQGLGSCWVCAALFAPDEVRRALALPEHWEPQAIITLGYPDEARVSTRKPLEEITVWR